MLLTEQLIETIATPTKPTRHKDGDRLYLLVNPDGSKWWRYDYQFGGKRNTLSMGVYPGTGLSAARQRKDNNKKLLAEGINPSDHAKAEKLANLTASKLQRDTRFLIDDNGALSLKLGRRSVVLTQAETMELRAFLEALEGIKPVACTNPNSETGAQDQKLAHPPSQDAQPLPQLQDKREKPRQGYIHVGTKLVRVEVCPRRINLKASLKL